MGDEYTFRGETGEYSVAGTEFLNHSGCQIILVSGHLFTHLLLRPASVWTGYSINGAPNSFTESVGSLPLSGGLIVLKR